MATGVGRRLVAISEADELVCLSAIGISVLANKGEYEIAGSRLVG